MKQASFLCLKLILAIFFLIGDLYGSDADYLFEYFKNSKKPPPLVELSGGLSGAKNYRFASEGKEYVLRILNPEDAFKDRRNEIQAAAYAGELGIAPFVYYTNPGYDAMIMQFIKGQTLNSAVLENKEQLRSLIQTIKKLHDSTGNFPVGRTIFKRIKSELAQIQQGKLPAPAVSIKQALNKLASIEDAFKQEPLVPCHNDLNALNIIFDGTSFKLIDWTDAGMGYAYGDLGYLLLTNNIEKTHWQEVLEIYLGRPPSDAELRKLQLMIKVNLLRIFASTFLAHQIPIKDPQLRARTQIEIEKQLLDGDLPPPSHYFKLHARGQLKGNEVINRFSLSALRAFLNDENH